MLYSEACLESRWEERRTLLNGGNDLHQRLPASVFSPRPDDETSNLK